MCHIEAVGFTCAARMSGAAKGTTPKLGNSPYFFNTHFEKQRFSSPFPWRADNGYF
jgi:hypothetical protein